MIMLGISGERKISSIQQNSELRRQISEASNKNNKRRRMIMGSFLVKKPKVKYFFIFLIISGFVLCQGLANQDRSRTSLKDNQEEPKHEIEYNFSVDWFSSNIPKWEKILSRFKEKPYIHYLEIGVFEGRSAIWMLENILTHSTARITCIDIFPADLKQRFLDNIKISGFTDKVTTLTGLSQILLRYLPLNSFDIIYIDGSHHADDVLADAVLCWPLLKENGLLIFDDYLWYLEELPVELRPRIAVDAFITCFRNYIEVVSSGYQRILKKRKITFSSRSSFPVGQYEYSWGKKILYRSGTNESIELSDIEKNLIERLIRSRKFGETKFSPENELLNDEMFLNLIERLGLKLDF